MSEKRIDIIIVTHNSESVIGGCMDSLRSCLWDETANITIVDSGSADTSYLKRLEPDRLITLQNLGYGSAANMGARGSEAEWLAVLNPDTRISVSDLNIVCDELAAANADAGAPALTDRDGHSRVPRIAAAGPFWRRTAKNILLEDRHHMEVEVLQGSILLVRRTAFEAVNGFDEKFFLYCEEDDLCARLRQRGSRLVLVKNVSGVHEGEASSEAVSPAWRKGQRLRGRAQYFNKHYSLFETLLVLVRDILRLAKDSGIQDAYQATLIACRDPRHRLARFGLSRPRVVFIYINAHRSGDVVAIYLRELAEHLRARGYEVDLSGAPVRAGTQAIASSNRFVRLQEQVRFLVGEFLSVRKRRHDVDVVVTLDVPSGTGLAGWLVRLWSGGRVRHISWVMDLYRLQDDGGSLIYRARRWIELLSLRWSGEIVTIGECMRDTLTRHVQSPVRVIELWHGHLVPEPSDRSLANEDDSLTCLYAGHAGHAHDLDSVIRAFGAMSDVPISLTVVGQGTAFERARHLANQIHVRNVRFQSPVSSGQIHALAADADVHLISLREEATGTCVPSKTYAAMASRSACLYLGSERGQGAMDVRRARAGEVVGTQDADAISRLLRAYVRDPELVSFHAKNGWCFLLEHRSLKSQGGKWEQVISGNCSAN